MDEKLAGTAIFKDKASVWTKEGALEAVKCLVNEKNTLFDSLIGKLNAYQDLKEMIYLLLFQGQVIMYNADDTAADMLLMFGLATSTVPFSTFANPNIRSISAAVSSALSM